MELEDAQEVDAVSYGKAEPGTSMPLAFLPHLPHIWMKSALEVPP